MSELCLNSELSMSEFWVIKGKPGGEVKLPPYTKIKVNSIK